MHDGSSNTPIDTAPTRPSEPYFIVPPGFRPNTFFVGMEKEYQELDRRLFDKRRRDGTACVLLYGQPGGGKSHLARQYINKNKGKFSGGIFWITSTSREERWHAFWNIKQKVVARDSPGLCEGVNGNDFVKLVKTWFETRHEWLIVFDGVFIDRDEDATELMNFIPDSKNSSIIYVSRQKNLESKQRLLRPFPIKVGALKEDDARKLLFKELHIKKPTEAQKKKATELVKKIGGLPLAIDAISHRLADTGEPLTKYKLSTSVGPALEETYTHIFDELLNLQHFEAWNLINILCWFAGSIPVEMIHLGLKALRADKIEVKSVEDVGEPDINTTFGILMRYALIERNEPDSDKDSISSSRDSLVDPEPIDMLKIHGVVQSFCCDSLNARRMLPQWLGYAVKLFSHSFRQADVKIKQKPEPGRVSDYRYYLVHGQRLWDHSLTYESRIQPLQGIRNILHPVIDLINTEIRAREPDSSQESLKNGLFQVSIFDRTSSSSDSGPSLPGPPTPNRHPAPPPLDSESLFGIPLDKEPTDSPRSFGTASPGLRPKILDHSPNNARPLEDDDDVGYDSDREGLAISHPMRQNLSELTEKPSNRSRAPTAESHVGGWQIVPPARRPKKRRGRRDLGSFRPTAANVQLDRRNAENRASGFGTLHRRESSPAFKSLEKMRSKEKSPPPAFQERIAGFFQRTLSRDSKPSTPTWAGVAAGKVAPPAISQPGADNPASTGQVIPYPVPPPLQRERTEEILRDQSGNIHPPSSSPLATEFLPNENYNGSLTDERTGPQYVYYRNDPSAAYPPGGFAYTTPYPGSNSSLSRLSQYSEPRPVPVRSSPYYTPPPLGPNAAALPIEESTTITTSARRPSAAGYAPNQPSPLHRPSPPSSQSRASPSYAIYPSPYPPPPLPDIPAGYSSQPMSRDQSHQSAHSNAATEPMIYNPTFSPHIGPTAVLPITDPIRPLPVFAPQPQYPYPFPPHQPGDSSPREGRPLRKSPKSTDPSTTPGVPVGGPNMSGSAAGASHTHPPSPLQQAPRVSESEPMSRSSSGPGIHLTDPATGQDMGVVAFEASPTMPSPLPTAVEAAGRVQFGAHAPISIPDAQRRTWEAEMRLRERDAVGAGAGGERRRSAPMGLPYPDVNLIPTQSDGGALRARAEQGRGYPDVGVIPTSSDGAVLEEMVRDGGMGGRGRGRERGRSEPEPEGVGLGLGVDLGEGR